MMWYEAAEIFWGGLCWGSFLNVVAYRIVFDKSFFTARSRCPTCNTVIAWYDNIPLISWLFLHGACRTCKAKIIWLYPFLEFTTSIVFFCLTLANFNSISALSNLPQFLTYTLFFSALIVATRTDLEAMVIPQLFSLWLVPIGITLSFLEYTKCSGTHSILGALFGYTFLWGIARIFKYFTNKDGLGVGDMELLALIGAFLGPLGVWATLLISSLSGLLIGGGALLIFRKSFQARIPFGPFLALGATLYYFFHAQLIAWLLF